MTCTPNISVFSGGLVSASILSVLLLCMSFCSCQKHLLAKPTRLRGFTSLPKSACLKAMTPCKLKSKSSEQTTTTFLDTCLLEETSLAIQKANRSSSIFSCLLSARLHQRTKNSKTRRNLTPRHLSRQTHTRSSGAHTAIVCRAALPWASIVTHMSPHIL